MARQEVDTRRNHLGRGGRLSMLMLGVLLVGACTSDPAAGPLDALPRQLTGAEEAVIDAGNHFAFNLFREATREQGEGNIFLSPVSASMALGMAMNGASGQTLTEMRETLGFGDLEREQINASYRDLMRLLVQLDPAVDMQVANSLWSRQGYPFSESFFDVAREYFSARVEGMAMTPGDANTINAWVSEATGGWIPSIVEEIRPEEVMFLINAVYFKGAWTKPFDPAMTRDEPFHLEGGGSRMVPMMRASGTQQYSRSESFEVVDLPYGNGAFSMTILLPLEGRGVDEVVRSLDAQRWREVVNTLSESRLDLVLPRFRLEYEQELSEVLQAMGMRQAFAPGGADFSGMVNGNGENLYLSSVLQKTFVEVNEEGTEAAAATSVGVSVTSLPPTMRIDRPFLFAIRENFSGAILFLGKVADPA